MEKIHEHLADRPIAPIFNASNEKDNEIAMKLMCVIDYFLEKRQLNGKIDAVPKLREQLMRFWSYESFRFYSYKAPYNWFGKEILQCKRCEFIGPYLMVHTHMAITHDLHIGLKKCVWCSRTDYEKHIEDDTAQECYEVYLAKEQLQQIDVPNVVLKFYDMLQSIGNALEVKIERSPKFAGIGYAKNDVCNADSDSDGGLDRRIVVYSRRRKHLKEINTLKLNKFFCDAMQYFHPDRASEICELFAGSSQNNEKQCEYNNTKHRKTSKYSETNNSVENGQATDATQAFATFVALKVETIKDDDVKQRTMRMIHEVIFNGQQEDKTKLPNGNDERQS